MATIGLISFGYDANGNQTSRNISGSSYTLSYDAENHLVSVSGAVTASFLYDGDGNRVKGIFGGMTTTYIGNYFEWTGSTTTMIKYYYAGVTRVAMRTGSSTINYLLGDHLGSTSITANSSGVKSAEVRYMPWGTERYTYSSTPTTYRFTGQRAESGLGLYFYNSRWYDPAAGRFVQPDSIIPQQQGVQAWDRYGYVNNNPVKYTDPTGHKMVCDPEDPNCNQEARLEILQDNKQDPQQLLINEESILDSNLDGIVINSPDISNTPTVESDGTLENLYNNENTNASPPPLEVRAITIVFALPFFNIADITLAELTVMVAQAALADPEPATKLLLTVGELVIVGADLALAYGEVSYAHWVVTGEWINSWDDLSNWTIMP